jgi:ribosome biogenesis GTPase
MILQSSNIDAIVCLNKCDMATDESKRLDIYREIGLSVIETSAKEGIGITQLKDCIKNKQAIFVGNSGVGKSSLTNAIMGDDEIKTSHVSDKSKRGRHTTTTSKYYVWEENSSIIDTPGIRSLDVSSFNAIEIQDYFPEFDNWKDKCKYNDCLHFNEPYDSCIVKQGVASGLISADRYESYLRIMGDVLGDKDYERILNEILPEHKKNTRKK